MKCFVCPDVCLCLYDLFLHGEQLYNKTPHYKGISLSTAVRVL